MAPRIHISFPASAKPPCHCERSAAIQPPTGLRRLLRSLAMTGMDAIANVMADQPDKGEYRSGHDPRTLRDALGCFATGVTIVTCLTDWRPAGLTVNSFTSVSLEPPLLLVCIHKRAASAAALINAPCFAINVLQNEQQPASMTFSTRGEDRFGNTPWSRGEN